jgi:hypothetical protein
LVGIAGEDDLDAPDLNVSPGAAGAANGREALAQASDAGNFSAGSLARSRPAPNAMEGRRSRLEPVAAPALRDQLSAVLRDELLAGIAGLRDSDEAALWAHRALPAKNTLTDADARQVEEAFEAKVATFSAGAEATRAPNTAEVEAAAADPASVPSPAAGPNDTATVRQAATAARAPGIDKADLALSEPRRQRDRDHLKFVTLQACLLCGRRPSDAHHLRFAQSAALGRSRWRRIGFVEFTNLQDSVHIVARTGNLCEPPHVASSTKIKIH